MYHRQSEMKAFADIQIPNGQIAHDLNQNPDAKSDINSQFALYLLRDYLWTGEDQTLSSAAPGC